MTAADITSVLDEELEIGELLAETLECQRRALLKRDLERISELTGVLEGQMEHFSTVVEARVEAMTGEDVQLGEHCGELLQRVRHIEARILRLAEINQDLIADRLAYVGAMLSTVGLTGAAGYGAQAPASALSRSA
jgi:hypothetical protein